MTVVNPKSISGINSITTGSGSDNLLTIHTSDASSTERVRINSSGDVIVGSGITVSPDGDIFATGVTTSTTFVGALTGNVTGNISGGTVAGSTGTFSGAVSGTTGTFTGDVDIADKIVHTGDTNTAIRFPSADTITAETGGSERVRVTSAGNFGIGTASPDESLHISGNSSGAITAKIENTYSSDATRFAILELKSGVGSIRFHDQGDTLEGEIKYDSTTNSMRFHTNSNTERLRIDSSGRLGIQGAATKGVLDVRASGGSATMLTAVFGANEGQTGGTLSDNADKGGRVGLYHYDTDEEPFGLFSYGASNGSNSLNFGGGTSLMNAATNLGFFTAANSTTTTGTKRMDINSSGDITINTGNLIMGTSGKGISFAATGDGGSSTPDSEVFDDYEEGTWNVTSLNYDYDGNQAQRGRYIKIGKMVYAFYRVKLSNQSTHVGDHMRWSGLPFTAASGGQDDIGVGAHAMGYNSASYNVYTQPGSTYAYLYTTSGTNYNNGTGLNQDDMRGCIIYRASS